MIGFAAVSAYSVGSIIELRRHTKNLRAHGDWLRSQHDQWKSLALDLEDVRIGE